MRRLHLFELEDQPWFPSLLRDAGTTYLRFALQASGHARLLAGALQEVLRATGARKILDLCSGGGGPIVQLVDELAAQGLSIEVELTDKYPNLPALRAAAEARPGRVTFSAEPVDATAVDRGREGLRTLFNAFHHFREEDARRILQDAVDARRPIAVFEVVDRGPATLLGILLSPLLVCLSMPFLRPLRPAWLLWTYVVPVIPLFVLWDGLVSWLRVYSQEELQSLLATLDAPGYTFHFGKVRLGRAPAHATWMWGAPEQGRDARAARGPREAARPLAPRNQRLT